jgi:arylsulfatase A-like enzyme
VHVVMIVLDCVRADHVGCYGYGRRTTPNLDALAGEGTRFEVAVSAGVWSLPAMASMLTGLYPSQHGLNRADRSVDPALPLLAERLRAAGWHTAAFSANPYVTRSFGFDRGFEEFRDLSGITGANGHGGLASALDSSYRWLRPRVKGVVKRSQALTRAFLHYQHGRAGTAGKTGRSLAQAAASWIGRARDQGSRGRPSFTLVHFMEAHFPYAPGAQYVRGFMDEPAIARAEAVDQDAMAYLAGANPLGPTEFALLTDLYDASIREADELLGVVLDAAGDDTLILVTADHGNHFGEHGLMGHFFSVYDALARVPLVVRHPALPAGMVARRPVQLIDVVPTVLESAGLDHAGLPGVSLAAASDPRRCLVTEYLDPDVSRFARFRGADVTRYRRELRAVRQDGHKYIWASDGHEELYDLTRDPAECQDLAAADPERLAAFRELHEQWCADVAGVPRGTTQAQAGLELDSEVAASLRALGYFD